jgi:hypothetical protein
MSPDGIVEGADIAFDFGARFSPGPEDGAPDAFAFSVLKNVSTMALSKPFAFPDIEITLPFFLSSA